MNRSDADRLELLERIADRVPELDLDAKEVAWTRRDDGLGPLVPDCVGCVVIKPDSSRELARVVPDPPAEQRQ